MGWLIKFPVFLVLKICNCSMCPHRLLPFRKFTSTVCNLTVFPTQSVDFSQSTNTGFCYFQFSHRLQLCSYISCTQNSIRPLSGLFCTLMYSVVMVLILSNKQEKFTLKPSDFCQYLRLTCTLATFSTKKPSIEYKKSEINTQMIHKVSPIVS